MYTLPSQDQSCEVTPEVKSYRINRKIDRKEKVSKSEITGDRVVELIR